MLLDPQIMKFVLICYLMSVVVVVIVFRLTSKLPTKKSRLIRSAVLAAFIGPGAISGYMAFSPAPPIFALVINLWTGALHGGYSFGLFFTLVPFYVLWPIYYLVLVIFTDETGVTKHNKSLKPGTPQSGAP